MRSCMQQAQALKNRKPRCRRRLTREFSAKSGPRGRGRRCRQSKGVCARATSDDDTRRRRRHPSRDALEHEKRRGHKTAPAHERNTRRLDMKRLRASSAPSPSLFFPGGVGQQAQRPSPWKLRVFPAASFSRLLLLLPLLLLLFRCGGGRRLYFIFHSSRARHPLLFSLLLLSSLAGVPTALSRDSFLFFPSRFPTPRLSFFPIRSLQKERDEETEEKTENGICFANLLVTLAFLAIFSPLSLRFVASVRLLAARQRFDGLT